jgi:hypothetical protein
MTELEKIIEQMAGGRELAALLMERLYSPEIQQTISDIIEKAVVEAMMIERNRCRRWVASCSPSPFTAEAMRAAILEAIEKGD